MDHQSLFREHLSGLVEGICVVLSELGRGSVVFGSGEQHLYFQDDEAAPFRTDRHFAWLCPLLGSGHFLRIAPGKKPLLIRCVPNSYWCENPESPALCWASEFEIEVAETPADAWKKLRDLGGRAQFIGSETRFAAADGLVVNSETLITQLDWLRSVKSSYEIESIAEANCVAAQGHRAAANVFLQGGSEFDAMLAYLGGVGASEKDLSFAPIFAMDQKAATLHYEHRRHVKNGKVLLVDAGAVCRNYASDISRTTLAPNVHSVFRDLWVQLNTLQQSICQKAVAGTTQAKMQFEAFLGIAEILENADVIRMNGDYTRALREGILRTFCPHSLGHSLGICTHDVGDFVSNRWGVASPALEGFPTYRMGRVLEPGYVITVEPGIYFVPMLLQKMRDSEAASCFNWPLIDELIPMGGMRIEDDVVVTKGLPRNITREFLP